MAKVPTYDSPQAKSSPLAAPRTDFAGPKSLANSADFFGAVQAREKAAMGKALVQAGAQGADIITRMQLRENEDSIFRAEVSLKEEYLKTEQEWHEKRRGRFATDLTNDAQAWWDDAARRHTEDLTPVQAREFQKRLLNLRAGSLNSISRFQAQELEKSHDEAFEANKKISISLAAQNPSGENIVATTEQMKADNVSQAARKGWSAERLKLQNLADTTLLHKNIIQGMVQSDPGGAAAYFEEHKADIDGAQHAEIGGFARKASATALGQEASDAVWMKLGPKEDNEPANIDKMEDQLRSAIKNNPDALDAALKATRERFAAFNNGVRERAAANGATIADAINEGKSIREIQLMPEYLNLPGDQRLKWSTAVENMRYQKGARAAQEESRAATRENRLWTQEQRSRARENQQEQDLARSTMARYWDYDDPTVLNGMTRNEVKALLPELGRINTDKLLKEYDRLKGDPNKVIEAKVDTDDFNQIAQGAGLKPFDPKKSEEERAGLGALKFHIENEIDRAQAAAKRPLTRQEKQAIMTREMDNKVLVERFMRPDPSKPVSILSPREMNNAYVVVDGTEVKLSDIPGDQRAEIIRLRKSRGLPVTEQLIAQTWIRSGRGRKPPETD